MVISKDFGNLIQLFGLLHGFFDWLAAVGGLRQFQRGQPCILTFQKVGTRLKIFRITLEQGRCSQFVVGVVEQPFQHGGEQLVAEDAVS